MRHLQKNFPGHCAFTPIQQREVAG
jgi:hypothetical protein